MTNQDKATTFRTADLAMTGALCVSGFVIDKMERVTPTRSVFIFRDSAELQEAVGRYWRGELRVDPQIYFNQLRVLKARIYER